MSYELRITKPTPWKMGLTGVESIKQNISVICTTLTGTVPLDRDFGIDSDVIDLPIESAKALISVQLLSAIETLEPRAQVTSIDFDVSDEDNYIYGRLVPVIRFIERGEDEG